MKWIRLWCEEIWCGSTFSELNTYQFGVWMKLLIAAGLRDNDGTIPSYLIKNLSKGGPNSAFKKAIETLVRNNKITQNEDESLSIVKWANYQTRYEKYYKGKQRPIQGKLAYTCHTDTEGDTEGD